MPTEAGDHRNVILVNQDLNKEFGYEYFVVNLKEQHDIPDALVIETLNPDAEFLAVNDLTPLSGKQRAAFDRDGIVLLLQHALVPRLTMPIATIAAKAVEFAYETLTAQVAILTPDLKRDDAQEIFDAAWAARTNDIIANIDQMPDAERINYFIAAFRNAFTGTDSTVIDRYVNDQREELRAALTEAWAERRHFLQRGQRATRMPGA
ncbi:hypothetical protein IP69_13750 [Bosea sp. AAP35]|uniref:hypothetical protein n=1 Tax=Bosea sp. AAP35 TaxID=1523417 RepID=UPI0006B9D9D4|nr:hypothetical protein [Bosea sp. AAP35]KPF67395.1 hypothetical protein IP69_13750 [Bosea sp. AAP35]